MRPFLLTPEKIAELKKLCEYAQAHELTEADIRDIEVGEALPISMRPEFRVEIPVGFVVLLTIDHTRMRNRITKAYNRVKIRHLSVSLEDGHQTHKLPHPAVIEEIMKHVGFTTHLSKCQIRQLDDKIEVCEILPGTETPL